MKTKWSIAALLVVTTSLLLTASSPTGVSPTLVYSTYLGSSEGDGPNSWLKRFSLDDSGTIYFAQSTYHTDFPTTANAYSKTYNGGSEKWGKEDLAIVEFNTRQNALKYASYFGGTTGPDFVTQVLRHKNSVYLAGNTGSSDLPVTSNAYDKTFNGPDFRHADGFIARFDDNKLAYLTYLGTSGADWIQSIFVNDNGEMIVVGVFKEWNELPITHKFSDEKRGAQRQCLRHTVQCERGRDPVRDPAGTQLVRRCGQGSRGQHLYRRHDDEQVLSGERAGV